MVGRAPFFTSLEVPCVGWLVGHVGVVGMTIETVEAPTTP